MGCAYLLDTTDTSVSLDLTLTQEGVGGLTGQAPTVALRDATTTGSYLDWLDNTFKTVGWFQKYKVLTEVEKGHYRTGLNLTVLVPAITSGSAYVAEFELSGAGSLKGVDHDVLLVGDFQFNVELLRKALTNRMTETPGAPGVLTLYDDDDINPILAWNLQDSAGGPIFTTVGAPARRLKAVRF